jgi:hypothetical protein
MPMGFLDRVKAALGVGGEGSARARESGLSTGAGQKGTAATGSGTGDPVRGAVPETDPATQSVSAEQTPEEQRQAAAEDPAASVEPGTEGQDQDPR